MAGKLNRAAYEQLIEEDIAWLRRFDLPNTLELRHIIQVLQASVALEYSPSAVLTNQILDQVLRGSADTSQALVAEVERLRTELQTAAQCNAANILGLHRADQLIGELKAERKDALEVLATVAGVNGYSPEESFPRAIRTDNRFRATVDEVGKLRAEVVRLRNKDGEPCERCGCGAGSVYLGCTCPECKEQRRHP